MSSLQLSTGITRTVPVSGTAIDPQLSVNSTVVFHIQGQPGTYLIINDTEIDATPTVKPPAPVRVTNRKEREEFFRDLLDS